MPFSSMTFLLLFLPCVLLLYYLFSFSTQLQNVWLLAASLFIYAAGQKGYALLLTGSILWNWLMALFMERAAPRSKKALLTVAVIVNLGALAACKYLPFLGEIADLFMSTAPVIPHIVLPVGLSFYTLQAIGYCVDVYRGDAKAARNPVYVGLHLSFFPKIIAGPLISWGDMAAQMRSRKFQAARLSAGVYRFALGLVKKVLLGSQFALLADNIFNWNSMGRFQVELPVTLAWFGLLVFALQIYYELSGFTDMAIGLAAMFGFDLPENFDYPYAATSVTGFWRRWNITLTAWFRQYLYRPMSGRGASNNDITVRNLLVVWALIGLWHGSDWTMLFFGAWFFVLILMEHFFGLHESDRMIWLRRIYTLLAVLAGWVLLRAGGLYETGRYFMNLAGVNNNAFLSDVALVLLRENFLWIVAGILFSLPVGQSIEHFVQSRDSTLLKTACNILQPLLLCGLFIVSIIYMLQGNLSTFTYF